MKWRMNVGYVVVAALLFIQMGLNVVATPTVRADDGLLATHTPTPTPTPVNGHCNDFQCGLH